MSLGSSIICCDVWDLGEVCVHISVGLLTQLAEAVLVL